MSEPTPREVFLDSVRRCLASEEFIPSFYKRFLASSDEIRDKFRATDFKQQNKMLARSLQLCAGATAGDSESLAEIRDRAISHDRHHLNIPPRMYDHWLDSIVETAGEFDEQWTDGTEAAWRRVLGHVVQHMIRQY